MKITAYLSFDGQCEAAFKFCTEALGGEISGLFKYGGSPMADQVPPECANQVMHATLILKDQAIMAADVPGRYETPRGFSMTIGLGDAAEAERIFEALSEGGKVKMPLQETFWAARFGMLTDRFGIPWMINCETTNSAAFTAVTKVV